MATKVMFTAVLQKGGNYGPFSGDMTVVFNNPITNIGGAYNNTSGIFTAPVTGCYYFTFFHDGQQGQKTGLALIKNNQEIIVKTYDASSNSDADAHGGNAAFLQLEQGDQVSIRLPADHSVWAAGNTTTFSGFLVSQN